MDIAKMSCYSLLAVWLGDGIASSAAAFCVPVELCQLP